MIRNIFFLLSFLAMVSSCAPEGGLKYKKIPSGIVFQSDSLKKRILFYGDGLVRISVTRTGDNFNDSSLAVILQPEKINFSVKRGDGTLLVGCGSLLLKVDEKNGVITFLRGDGKEYLKEHGKELPQLTDTTLYGEHFYSVRQGFVLSTGEGVYGLGQFQNGIMNYRYKDLLLVQANKQAIVPLLISTKDYGILWDNYSHTTFHDGQDGTFFASRVAKQIDYYFIGSGDMDRVIAGYRHLTGRAPLFAKKAYGFWQSRERYPSFPALLEVIKNYRQQHIPLDNIVQDWRYWGDNTHWSSMRFDPETFPDPEKYIRRIHAQHVGLMVSIWPALGPETDIYKEMDAKGFLYTPEHWTGGRVYDAYNPEARDIYWRYIRDGLIKYGVDALWMDATEPEIHFANTPEMTEKGLLETGTTWLGPAAEYLNTYALVSSQGVYRHFREDVPDKRVFILTRSSWAGQQRNATVTWSGDIGCSYDYLKKQIPAGINFCMAGVPYWTHDIGGFFPGRFGGEYPDHMDDPAYRELYVRWFQYGAFTPIFRSHGTGKPREVWRFKEPLFYDALTDVIRLRYRLFPYVYSLAWQVTENDYTIMRGLVMDFQEDENTYNIGDQYMFGPAFLVKPVTRPMYYDKGGKKLSPSAEDKKVNVYLPKHTGWYDYRTNRFYPGGKVVAVDCPLKVFPLFVKAGSIVPFGPEICYAEEKGNDTLEIRVYGGADAEFTFYEDEGNTYHYEKGAYNTITFRWDDGRKTLTIGESTGSFDGFVKEKHFSVVLIAPEEQGETTIVRKEYDYDGSRAEVVF